MRRSWRTSTRQGPPEPRRGCCARVCESDEAMEFLSDGDPGEAGLMRVAERPSRSVKRARKRVAEVMKSLEEAQADVHEGCQRTTRQQSLKRIFWQQSFSH